MYSNELLLSTTRTNQYSTHLMIEKYTLIQIEKDNIKVKNLLYHFFMWMPPSYRPNYIKTSHSYCKKYRPKMPLSLTIQ